MKKITVFLSFLLVCSLIFISCQAEVKEKVVDKSLVGVEMNIAENKTFSVKVPDTVAKYEYKALPQFNLEDEDLNDIQGERLEWTEIGVNNKRASLGYFAQGKWRFEVRTLNNKNMVLARGETELFLQKGKANVITVTLSVADGTGVGSSDSTGKIVFGFETNRLTEEGEDLSNAYMKLEVDRLNTSGGAIVDSNIGFEPDGNGNYNIVANAGTGFVLKNSTFVGAVHGDLHSGDTGTGTGELQNSWTYVLGGTEDTITKNGGGNFARILNPVYGATVADNRIRFYAETPDLIQDGEIFKGGIKPGSYLVRARLFVKSAEGPDKAVAGQLIGVKVIEGETTEVIGTLVPEVYIPAALNVTIPSDPKGEIVPTDDQLIIQSDDLPNVQALTLTYTPEGANIIGEEGLTFEWYLNGNKIEGATEREFEFSPTMYGDAKISCVAKTIAHAAEPVDEQFGDFASAQIVIQVVPATGPNAH